MKKFYHIWVEGYQATGDAGKAYYLGWCYASSFQEACDKFCTKEIQKRYGNYDPKRKSLWGCRLFESEVEARRSFG